MNEKENEEEGAEDKWKHEESNHEEESDKNNLFLLRFSESQTDLFLLLLYVLFSSLTKWLLKLKVTCDKRAIIIRKKRFPAS